MLYCTAVLPCRWWSLIGGFGGLPQTSVSLSLGQVVFLKKDFFLDRQKSFWKNIPYFLY